MRPILPQQAAGSGLQGRASSHPGGAAPRRRRRAAVPAAAAASKGEPDPHALLQVPRGASRRAIRAAYIERIKLLHPDVSPAGQDTTAAAAALNAAYEQLMEGEGARGSAGPGAEGRGASFCVLGSTWVRTGVGLPKGR